jgi:hypothetical protein
MDEWTSSAMSLASVTDEQIRSATRIIVRSTREPTWFHEIVSSVPTRGSRRMEGEPKRVLSIYIDDPATELPAAIARVEKVRGDVWNHTYPKELVFRVLQRVARSLAALHMDKPALLQHMMLPCGIGNNGLTGHHKDVAAYIESEMDDAEKRQLIEQAIGTL